MPLYWTIDSKERLFTGFGEGEVTFDDAMSLLQALAGARALSYRKPFDVRAVQSTMTSEGAARGVCQDQKLSRASARWRAGDGGEA
jgi:hypothetical protein